MKLRLFANTLRLRMSQTDVERLASGETAEDWTHFPSGARFGCVLRSGAGDQARVEFVDGIVTVEIPGPRVLEWARDESAVKLEIGELPEGSPVVLIEKDFQCLHRGARPAREDSDSFPHPTRETMSRS